MIDYNDEGAPPLILDESEARECHSYADNLRECIALVRAGTRPALDRMGDLEAAAAILEKVYIAHHPPKHVCKGEQCEAWSIMRDRTRGYGPSEESAFVAGWHIAHE
jgi:hypothetical protein